MNDYHDMKYLRHLDSRYLKGRIQPNETTYIIRRERGQERVRSTRLLAS